MKYAAVMPICRAIMFVGLVLTPLAGRADPDTIQAQPETVPIPEPVPFVDGVYFMAVGYDVTPGSVAERQLQDMAAAAGGTYLGASSAHPGQLTDSFLQAAGVAAGTISNITLQAGVAFRIETDLDAVRELMIAAGDEPDQPDIHLLYTGDAAYAGVPPGTFAMRHETSWFEVGKRRAVLPIYGHVFKLDRTETNDDRVVWIFSPVRELTHDYSVFIKRDDQWVRTHGLRVDRN